MLDFFSFVTVYSLEIKRFFFKARMTCFDGLQKKSLKINNSGKTLMGRDLLTLQVQDDTDTIRGRPLY